MIRCPTCQTENPDGARFCNNCGSPLEAARPIEGERKVVTVLFADVAGSTALAERLDPEDWATIMNGAFGFMNAAIARYDGTVSRLMGDAVLAFFGAPRAHEDDAERAVRAGLEIRDAAMEYERLLRAEYGIDFRIRVGIHTGTAVLTTVGDEIKGEYTAMGDAPNIAARLQSVARPGTVLISADTYRLVRHAMEVEPQGATELKGKVAALDTYEVKTPRSTPDSRRGLEGVRSPLVGRDAELGELRGRVQQLSGGSGGILAVIGEAGLGKSRLVAELRDEAANGSAPPRWLECRGISYGQSLAYHPWKQLGQALIRATESDTPATVREKLQAFCRRLGIPDQDVPVLETLLGVRVDANRTSTIDATSAEDKQPMSDAVIRTIQAVIHETAIPLPHVLVFDDLHWADTASLELLSTVATLVSEEPLLVVCVLRPDKHAASWGMLDRFRANVGDRYAQLQIDPLDRARADELLSNLLDIQDLPDTVRTAILERSDGNPFFIEEVIRSLVDSGHLVRENGNWHATADISSVTIPETLAGVLRARIDSLPESTKRVAQAAAVLGRTFLERVLSTVCERTPPPPERVADVEPHLGTLRYEELVRERVPAPDCEYIFKHALTQETAYGLLLRGRRRQLHALAGQALEELYVDRIDEFAPVLAYHFGEGGDLERTADYSIRAAEGFSKGFALKETSDHYERAYAALRRMEQPPADKLLDTVLAGTVQRYRLRKYDGVIDRLLEVESLARENGDPKRLAQLLSWIALMYMLTGFASRGEPYLVESDALAKSLNLEKETLLPLFFATDVLIDQNPREAIERMGEVVQLARKHRMPEIEGHALASIALAHARIGDLGGTQHYIEDALAAAPSGGHRVKEADVYLLVGLAYLEIGNLEKGLSYLRLGTNLASQENALECVSVGCYFVGVGELGRQQIDEALKQFTDSVDVGSRAGWVGWGGILNRARGGIAAARLASGLPEAVEDLELSLANARKEQDEYHAAVLSEHLARIYLDRGEADRAEPLLITALAYYRRAEMRLYETRALETAVKLHESRGESDLARRARARSEELASAAAGIGS